MAQEVQVTVDDLKKLLKLKEQLPAIFTQFSTTAMARQN